MTARNSGGADDDEEWAASLDDLALPPGRMAPPEEEFSIEYRQDARTSPSPVPRPPEERAPAPPAAWRLFRGDGVTRRLPLPSAPPWRRFGTGRAGGRGGHPPYLVSPHHADVVNAALHLRRPLLVTGQPGTGKSSLAQAVAQELDLGEVLRWSVNSRSTVQEALYRYDAVGRLRETTMSRDRGRPEPDIGSFMRLGPLGTALVPGERPRVLLVDELDKGDVDLPNDLLTIFEEGEFEIPELSRLSDEQPRSPRSDAADRRAGDRGAWPGDVRRVPPSSSSPATVSATSRPPFCAAAYGWSCHRRTRSGCARSSPRTSARTRCARWDDLLQAFLRRRAPGELATDQLLNAVFLRSGGVDLDADGLLDAVLHRLSGTV